MKEDKLISEGKLIKVLDGEKSYDLDISTIKTIKYNLSVTRPLTSSIRITTINDGNPWKPLILPWNYKGVAAEITKINPRVHDMGIDYKEILLLLLFFIFSFIIFVGMRILGIK